MLKVLTYQLICPSGTSNQEWEYTINLANMVLLINNFPTVPSLGSGHVSMCLAYSGYVTDSVDAEMKKKSPFSPIASVFWAKWTGFPSEFENEAQICVKWGQEEKKTTIAMAAKKKKMNRFCMILVLPRQDTSRVFSMPQISAQNHHTAMSSLPLSIFSTAICGHFAKPSKNGTKEVLIFFFFFWNFW